MSKDINEMSMKEMLDEFNSITGKNVTRFASRTQAVKRLFKARESVNDLAEAIAPRLKKIKEAKPKKVASNVDRSAAISSSWKKPGVLKARSIKQHVRVGGTEYRSVLAAFEALNLPIKKHIPFRAELKAAGRKEFEGHIFTIVKAEA